MQKSNGQMAMSKEHVASGQWHGASGSRLIAQGSRQCYKGQYFSFDAIVASVIFILALVALLSYWHSVRSSLELQNADVTREAFRISNILLTPGYIPPNTITTPDQSCHAMTQLGLSISWDDRRIDRLKFQCVKKFNSPPYSPEDFQRTFGTAYRVSVHLINESQSIAADKDQLLYGHSLPSPAPASIKNIARIRRIITLTDNPNVLPAGQQPVDEVLALDIYVYRDY